MINSGKEKEKLFLFLIIFEENATRHFPEKLSRGCFSFTGRLGYFFVFLFSLSSCLLGSSLSTHETFGLIRCALFHDAFITHASIFLDLGVQFRVDLIKSFLASVLPFRRVELSLWENNNNNSQPASQRVLMTSSLLMRWWYDQRRAGSAVQPPQTDNEGGAADTVGRAWPWVLQQLLMMMIRAGTTTERGWGKMSRNLPIFCRVFLE